MQWFMFLVTLFGWLILFSLAREKNTFVRNMVFFMGNLILGASLASGIEWPSGLTSVTVGTTTTHTFTYTLYTAATSGANAFPLIFGLMWAFILWGAIGMFSEAFTVFSQLNKKPVLVNKFV